SALFNKAVFEGPVNFILANIAGQFGADEAKFSNKEQGASFNSMKVGGSALFNKVVFEGPVSFVSADIGDFFAAQVAKFQNKEKTTTFSTMKVGGSAFFDGAVFEGPVDFGFADFGRLSLSGASWPKVAAKLRLRGMNYKTIVAVPGNEVESHKALLKLAD